MDPGRSALPVRGTGPPGPTPEEIAGLPPQIIGAVFADRMVMKIEAGHACDGYGHVGDPMVSGAVGVAHDLPFLNPGLSRFGQAGVESEGIVFGHHLSGQ